MRSNLIIGIILSVIVMGPALILISSSLRETKIEKKKPIIKLKINYVESFFYFLIYFLLFAFIWGFAIFKIKSWMGILLFFPLNFLGSIDFVIVVSHLINYFKRTIYWNRKSEKLMVNGIFDNFEIDLNSPNISIIKYYPPIGSFSGRAFPGFGFSVLKISDGKHTIKISNFEYDDYNLDMILHDKNNYIEKKRQFNIIF